MKFDSERILSLTALIVGVGSLFVIVYQTRLIRQAQYASVRPYLYVALMANRDGVDLLLNNTGIGPAFIDDVRIRYQGRELASDPYDFYVGLGRGVVSGLSVDKVQRGRLIPAGATIHMLGAGAADGQKMLDEMLHLFDIAEVPRSWYAKAGAAGGDKAVIEIVFSSVYGDRWRVRSDRIVPEPL